MKFLYSICFLSINLLVQQYMSSKVLSCNVLSRVDAITYLYYRGVAFVLTSNGYYYIIREKDIHKNNQQFDISGKIPHLADCCDSALLRDLDDCQNESLNQHSIAFLKHISSGTTKYISLNISALFSEDKHKLWTEPNSIDSDLLLSEINIDYSKQIDAIFHTDNNGEIFFIQGEFYSGIEFHELCPQQKDQIKVYQRRKLIELNVSGTVDSAYYEPNKGTNPVLYLTNYDKMQYFIVEIDAKSSKCAQNNNGHNSSYLSMDGMASNEWTPFYYSAYISIFSGFISYLLV